MSALGCDKLKIDAMEVMKLLVKKHTEGQLADDPRISYLITAWCRICRIMETEFAQFLPMLMESVKRTVVMKPEVALLNNDNPQTIEHDVDWCLATLGKLLKKFGIKTAGLEDVLVCDVRKIKEVVFAECVENVVKLMVPILVFNIHNNRNARMAAAESLPYLLKCAKIRGPEYIQGIWAYIFSDLLKAIYIEPEHEVQGELYNSLARCIELLGVGCLSELMMAEVLLILNKLLTKHFERATERHQADEDYDEAVGEQLARHRLSCVSDVLKALMSAHREAFFPHLDTLLLHLVVLLLAPNRPYADRQWAICIFNDVIEYGGPACVKYQYIFLEPMLSGLGSSEAKVRLAAAYGCGVLAQCGGAFFAAACARAVPLLIALVAAPNARAKENLDATEDAISAVAKIIKYNNSQIDKDEIIKIWLTWLPMEDVRKTPKVYSLLCELVLDGHPALTAAGTSQQHVISTLAVRFYPPYTTY